MQPTAAKSLRNVIIIIIIHYACWSPKTPHIILLPKLQYAAILAHIAPRPTTNLSNSHAGDRKMQAKMNEVAALFTRY